MAAPPHRSASSSSDTDDAAVVSAGDSALVSARRNFSYLVSPSTSTEHPARFRTRALLRTLNYIGKFILWRMVRWAKYVAIGSLAAAIGATAFGGAISGVAWIAAPPTLGASVFAATVWWVGKWGARRVSGRFGKGGKTDEELEMERDSPVRTEGTWRQETGPRAVPW